MLTYVEYAPLPRTATSFKIALVIQFLGRGINPANKIFGREKSPLQIKYQRVSFGTLFFCSIIIGIIGAIGIIGKYPSPKPPITPKTPKTPIALITPMPLPHTASSPRPFRTYFFPKRVFLGVFSPQNGVIRHLQTEIRTTEGVLTT